jgi:hypothetical protein
MNKTLYDQGCKEEAEEYFSHNPNLEKVGFVMLGEEELKNIEDGISVHINEDDVTIVDNPDYNWGEYKNEYR